jgi:hypothetical protein
LTIFDEKWHFLKQKNENFDLKKSKKSIFWLKLIKKISNFDYFLEKYGTIKDQMITTNETFQFNP